MMMSMRSVKYIVAAHYQVPVANLISSSRMPRIVDARRMAMYIAFTVLNRSLSDIGREFKKDHTCVRTAVQAVAERIERQDGAHMVFEMLAEQVKGQAVTACPHCLRPYEAESLSELRADMARLQKRIDAVASDAIKRAA